MGHRQPRRVTPFPCESSDRPRRAAEQDLLLRVAEPVISGHSAWAIRAEGTAFKIGVSSGDTGRFPRIVNDGNAASLAEDSHIRGTKA